MLCFFKVYFFAKVFFSSHGNLILTVSVFCSYCIASYAIIFYLKPLKPSIRRTLFAFNLDNFLCFIPEWVFVELSVLFIFLVKITYIIYTNYLQTVILFLLKIFIVGFIDLFGIYTVVIQIAFQNVNFSRIEYFEECKFKICFHFSKIIMHHVKRKYFTPFENLSYFDLNLYFFSLMHLFYDLFENLGAYTRYSERLFGLPLSSFFILFLLDDP